MTLKINKLSKTYKNGVKAINELDLVIEKGMFGLLGANGAGKSSLMRTIATLQNPDSGHVYFNDIDVHKNKMAFRKSLGYLPQEFGVYAKDSAEQLLNYFAILKGIASKKDRAKIVSEALHLTNLYDVRHKRVSTYSGGMRQRFGIAQLLLNNPKLIIVDEPTAGLDPTERNRFLNVLRDIGSDNIVIFSTHLVEDVKDLCSDMAVMSEGIILSKITPSNAIHSLEGKMWTIKTTKENLDSLKHQYKVLSSNYNEDNSINIRVFSDEKPGKEFLSVKPNLEDYYFSLLDSNQPI